MYISKLKLWNFRKYGSLNPINIDMPDLSASFQEGMNILIGENDSGKTAIIDAIKLVLKTHAYEWIRITEDDFYSFRDGNGKLNITQKLRIELEFSGLTDDEASNFIEWCGWGEESFINAENEEETKIRPKLNLIYEVELRDGRIIPSDVKAGMDRHGHPMNGEAREFLKTTYLKPLRDADNELTAKRNSRLSQILKEHKLFKKENDEEVQEFERLYAEVTESISNKFTEKESPYHKQIKAKIDKFLENFINKGTKSRIDLGNPEITNILEKLSLGILNEHNLGLGTMNRLFMAAELLHLKRENWTGLRLCLIEELEAHLHPQAQLKIISQLKKINGVQYILTTHSPNITSKADLRDLIICKGSEVFPLREENTRLELENYTYLERFLDVTKSNLFFSKGNIIVEGWSEEILLPVLAKKIGLDLTEKEISIINVGSTAYLHFAKIFLRKGIEDIKVPVSIITDKDIRPDNEGNFPKKEDWPDRTITRVSNLEELRKDLGETSIELHIAEEWTLEWCLYKSCFTEIFKKALSLAHPIAFEDFEKEHFIKSLAKREGETKIDKVKLANEFAILLEQDELIKKEVIEEDKYLSYLVKGIKHVCEYEN